MSACNPQHGLRRAEIQYPVRRHLLCYGIHQLRLGRLIEIDQHIATEHHVELPKRPPRDCAAPDYRQGPARYQSSPPRWPSGGQAP